ncbi:hypothetical protein BGZ68_002978 [Mortierella alpina]|nr:hypothetical protein BGZ68_002978 [Mortierella alpina]
MMTKITTLLWLVIAAITIVHGAPVNTTSAAPNLEAIDLGPILLLDLKVTHETLADLLRERFESTIGNTSAYKSFALIKTNQWQVQELYDCEPRIRPAEPIGTTLYCDDDSTTGCQVSIKYIDTQTVSVQDGITAEFSVSMSGGEPGVFEAKVSVSLAGSHTVTHTYSNGKEFTYTFPVVRGKICTPSIVSYYLQCKAIHWIVENDALSKPCGYFTDRYEIDFDDQHWWFRDPTDEDWFQYVSRDKNGVDHLLSFHVKLKAPPTSCEDVVQSVDMRTLSEKRNLPSSHAFLGLDNGQSFSMVSCVY